MSQLPRKEQGMALVVTLIMLLLMTMMVSSSFNLSTTNLEGVSNQQWRSEALAAVDAAIEQVVKPVANEVQAGRVPAAQTILVDINQDGTGDYSVQVAQPQCVRARLSSSAPPSSLTLVGMSNDTWNTVWEIAASVQEPASGASVRVRSGVRVLLSDAAKSAVCS